MLELAKRLTEAFGISGFEEEIRAAIREEIAGRSTMCGWMRWATWWPFVAGRAAEACDARRAHGSDRPDGDAHRREGLHALRAGRRHLPADVWGTQVRFADWTVGTVGVDGRRGARGADVPGHVHRRGRAQPAESRRRWGTWPPLFVLSSPRATRGLHPTTMIGSAASCWRNSCAC